MQAHPIYKLPRGLRVAVLRKLGYDVDGETVTRDGHVYHDPFSGQPVVFERSLILPGSAIVINSDPVSIALYLEAHPEAIDE